MRVTVGSDAYIESPVFVGADGETATDATGLPTATVVDGTGTTLAALTVDKATDDGPGEYRAKILHNVHTTQLDRLTVTWTATVDGLTVVSPVDVDVVGAVYLTPSQLRSVSGLDNPAKYPADVLARCVEEFADVAEEYCGVSFVPRLARQTIIQERMWRCVLAHPKIRVIRSVSVNGTAVSPSTLTVATAGWFDFHWGAGIGWTGGYPTSIAVVYEHGFDAPPETVLRACREYVRSTLLRSTSSLPRDVLSETVDGSTSLRYSTADWSQGRPTGFLNVDAALNQAPMFRFPAVA